MQTTTSRASARPAAALPVAVIKRDGTLAALVSAFPAIVAARLLLAQARRPEALDPAIRATIGAAMLHGAVLCGALFAARA